MWPGIRSLPRAFQGGSHMDVARVRQDDWAALLPVFINALRPSDATDPLADMGPYQGCAAVLTQERAGDSELSTIADELIDLAFDGHSDWHQHDTAWILRGIAAILDDSGAQQAEILDGLRAITGAAGDDERKAAVTDFAATMARYVVAWEGLAADDDVTERIAALRAAKLEELFTELATAGWNPDSPSESMPGRDQVIEAFDRQVEQLITGDVAS